ALKFGKGNLIALNADEPQTPRYLSRHLMDPVSGIAYEEPEPNLFSFNSLYGACPRCGGLCQVTEAAPEKIVPDLAKSLKRGAIPALGTYKSGGIFRQVEAVLENFGHDVNTPFEEMEEKVLTGILNGLDEPLKIVSKAGLSDRSVRFDGIIPYILEQAQGGLSSARKWAGQFTRMVECPVCAGSRLKKT